MKGVAREGQWLHSTCDLRRTTAVIAYDTDRAKSVLNRDLFHKMKDLFRSFGENVGYVWYIDVGTDFLQILTDRAKQTILYNER